MEKAQKIRKTRQQFINYPLVSMAYEVFDWILDEFDERIRVMNFEPIHIYVYNNKLKTTYGKILGKNMISFLEKYSFESLFARLRDIVNAEEGFEAILYPEDECCEELNILISIIS